MPSRACWFTVLLSLTLAAAPLAADDGRDGALQAFEQLKSLAGTWHGEAVGGGHTGTDPVVQEFRVASGGTVVMETMNQGTDDEMINMYHMVGEELVVTHYCSSGNQPTMKLATPRRNGREMTFEFTGGTNLDPSRDAHIHGIRVVLTGKNALESYWTGWKDGQEAGTRKFTLRRGE